ncbi:TetR/AcrR family transcriptional regulator [Haliea sp. E17]|uniref:TetR/AcrR family transcriptional regulator n=1 Tax=Haliea sp. E17 TaxID=3401576 RepID=UPI003AAF07D6
MTKKTPQQPDKPTRAYDNRKRERRAEQTRRRILEALAAQLASNNTPDFSLEQAAADAGVSRRTVFRHFPDRESMLAALAELVWETTGTVAIPRTPEEFVSALQASYRMFDNNAGLMQALLLSELGRGVRSRMREKRLSGNAAALDVAMAALPGKEGEAVKAVLGHLISAESWWQLRSTFGVQEPEASAAVSWVVRLVLDALHRGETPAMES